MSRLIWMCPAPFRVISCFIRATDTGNSFHSSSANESLELALSAKDIRQRALFRALHAFSFLCPDCGYCQGMGPIAVTLLCYFEPEVSLPLFIVEAFELNKPAFTIDRKHTLHFVACMTSIPYTTSSCRGFRAFKPASPFRKGQCRNGCRSCSLSWCEMCFKQW